MKITITDSQRLIAQEKNWSLLVVGLGFLVVGIGILLTPSLKAHVSILGSQNLSNSGNSDIFRYLIGGFFSLIGFGAVASRKIVRLELDKTTHTILLGVSTLFARKNNSYSFDDIAKVQLVLDVSTSTVNRETQTRRESSLLLIFRDGTTADLSDRQQGLGVAFGISIITKVPNQDVGQAIATFLGVPFEQLGPVSFQQAIGGVVDAIKQQSTASSVVPDRTTILVNPVDDSSNQDQNN